MSTGLNSWVATFVGACVRKVADATAFEVRATGFRSDGVST
jgi:hypothetical protein